MTKTALTLIAASAALALAAPALAAPPHLIGSTHAAGQYAAASATGHADHPAALYVRGTGEGLTLYAATSCQRGASVSTNSRRIPAAVSGRLYRLPSMPRAERCDVAATISGTGPIRLQILAR